MFFGCSERVLASNWSGGTGEKPMAVSSSKAAQENISIGTGLRAIPRTYLATRSKSQSRRGTGILPVGLVGVLPAGRDFTDSMFAEAVAPAGKMPAGPTDRMSVPRRSSRTNKNKIEHMNRPATK